LEFTLGAVYCPAKNEPLFIMDVKSNMAQLLTVIVVYLDKLCDYKNSVHNVHRLEYLEREFQKAGIQYW